MPSPIIPDTATIAATVRSFSAVSRARAEESIRRLCEHVAAAHGMTARVDWLAGYPVTVNTPDEFDRAAELARGLVGDRGFAVAPQPIPGSEDFYFVLEQVPGAFLGLGATPSGVDPATAPYNHSALARFSDAALAVGPAVLAALALDRLAQG